MRTSKGKLADPGLKCHWCGGVLKGVTVDEQYQDYRRHMASRDHQNDNGLENHNPSPAQWAGAYETIQAGREKAKDNEKF